MLLSHRTTNKTKQKKIVKFAYVLSLPIFQSTNLIKLERLLIDLITNDLTLTKDERLRSMKLYPMIHENKFLNFTSYKISDETAHLLAIE